MGEHDQYPRSQPHHEWASQTPQSAVSSFNLPLNPDPSLITPVSGSAESPRTMQIRSGPRPHATLNPSPLQPTLYSPQSAGLPGNSPPKGSDRQASSPEFPGYGYFDDKEPPTPYFGSFGVSMPSHSRSSPPSTIPTPSYTPGYDPQQPLLHAAPSHLNNAPILMPPNPELLRPIKRRRTNELMEPGPSGQALRPGQSPEQERQNRRRNQNPGSGRNRSSQPIKIRPDAELTAEERMLLQWKEEQSLPWKNIKENYEIHFQKTVQETALQMKYMRLKHRVRQWSSEDIEAMEKAVEYWEKNKWKIIADKMEDYGVEPKMHPKFVMQKWKSLFGDRPLQSATPGGDSSGSSPSPSLTDAHSPASGTHPPSIQPDYRHVPNGYPAPPADPYANRLPGHYQQLRPATGNQRRTPTMLPAPDGAPLSDRPPVAAEPAPPSHCMPGKASPVLAPTTRPPDMATAHALPHHSIHLPAQPGLMYEQRPPESGWAMGH